MSGNATTTTPRHRGDALLATLADRVGARLGTSTVFGTPVEREGVTVVPVAVARFGMGAGSGSDPAKHQEGEGGGSAGSVTPIGYIELKDGHSRYVPAVRPARMVALFLAAALGALLIARPAPATPRMRGPLRRG